jgi:hypothetical protein
LGGALQLEPQPTGFQIKNSGTQFNASGRTYIYIAIRRGPMKTPESGTEVFAPITRAGTTSVASVTGLAFPPDTSLIKNRGGSSNSVDWSFNFFDKIRSPGYRLSTAFTTAEDTSLNFITSFNQDGITFPSTGYTATNGSGYNYINYFLRRAPGFFDVVAYTGTGVAGRTVPHNLGVAPELMIVKARNDTHFWVVYDATNGPTKQMLLNYTNPSQAYSAGWNNTAPTASVFSTSYDGSAVDRSTNKSATNYIAYLFATLAGVSKVGTFTLSGSSYVDVDCGFSSGARFVLVKCHSTSGSWEVYDTARGITAGNDPMLALNSTAAENSGPNINPLPSGFSINAANFNIGDYIFLAIA